MLAKLRELATPNPRRVLLIVLCALGALPLILSTCGCAGFDYHRDVADLPSTRSAQDRGEILVLWRYGPPEWVTAMCRKPGQAHEVHGCAMVDEKEQRCLIFAVPPVGPRDRDRLAVIGHELRHCQGERH